MKEDPNRPTDLGRKEWNPAQLRYSRFLEPPVFWYVTAGVVLVALIIVVLFVALRTPAVEEVAPEAAPVSERRVGTLPGVRAA